MTRKTVPLRSMRTACRIQTTIRNPQPLDRPPVHQMLLYNLRRICRRHAAVPDSLWIYHHGRTMLALIQAPGLVDSHRATQVRRLHALLQLRGYIALSVRSAAGPWRPFRPYVMTYKNMTLKYRQSNIPPLPD